MTRWLVSTTSTLALLAFAGGRSAAAPMAAVSDSLLFGTADRTDAVRESLSLGAPAAPAIGAIGAAEPVMSNRPMIVDPSAQTPSATFTYRPEPPVGGDARPVGSVAGNSRRNPGNVSNLTGTIGADDAGIFSVPATEIAVNEMPEHAYNYLFRPAAIVGSDLAPPGSADIVPHEPFRDNPAHSVFIGVRAPVGDADSERAAREASIVGATGSATPTVVISALPGRPAAGGGLGYQLDAGPATTIGFSTADVRPTTLRFGAAASTTLGYTYLPMGPRLSVDPLLAAAWPRSGTLSATIAAPGGGVARRELDAKPDAASDPYDPPAVVSTIGAVLPLTRGAPNGVAADTFAIAKEDPSGGGGGIELLTIPIQVRGDLSEPANGARSLSITDAIEMNDTNVYVGYGLVVAAVLMPIALVFLVFRMIRRAALRRLG